LRDETNLDKNIEQLGVLIETFQKVEDKMTDIFIEK
jgi:hypothetical protein